MNFKKTLIIIFLFLTNCTIVPVVENKIITNNIKSFTNRGFALIYTDNLYNKKIINKKIDSRSLIIFQKNLKKGTYVKIKNILNEKSIIVKVGSNSNYPSFNNAVISERIAEEIELDVSEPYIEILEIIQNSAFIAKKAKTYEEEKNVATKVPIDDISINDLNVIKQKPKSNSKKKFNYIIKIADFYFKDTAKKMVDRIKKETSTKKINIEKLSSTSYRVYLGSFTNLKSLQKAFNDIEVLKFENIEIIKNDI
jgi:rare lipoprotein A (peptidoglycan hydrolase)